MLPLVESLAVAGVKKCGTKICEAYQFCSAFHTECEDCSKVCEILNHNFDTELCKSECRDYLHDQNYVKKSDFEAEIKSLKIYTTITFILALLVFILFFATNSRKIFSWMQSFSSKVRSKKPTSKIDSVTMANPNTESPTVRKKELHNASVYTITGTEYDQKTVSTPISRHPAEDTVDFSYDNRALQLTPPVDKPKTETNF